MKRLLYTILVCLTLGTPAAQASILDSLKTAAQQNNRSLKEARIDISMAREDRREAFTNYFPTIQAMGGVFQGFNHLMQADVEIPPINLGLGIPISLPPMSISEIKKGAIANVMAVQPVFAGGRIVNGNRLARLQEEIRQLQHRMTERDVLLQVERLYWQIVALKSNIGTLNAAEHQLEEVHRLVTNYVNAGLTTRNDVLRVELKQQELASSRLQLENGIALSAMTLAQLCGGCDSLIAAIDASSVQGLPETPSVQSLPETPANSSLPSLPEPLASSLRPEAQLSAAAVRAADLQVRMERGKNMPSAAVGIGDIYYNMMSKNVNNGVVFATLSVPISGWWGGTHALRKAKLARQRAEETRQNTIEQLALDNQMAYQRVQESWAQITIAEKSIASATENLRISMDEYRAGTLPLTDLLDAQTLHQQSSDRLIEARANYRLRLAEYQSKAQ